MTYQAKSSETEEQKIVIRWARVMQSRWPALENLYQKTARKHETTRTRVERAIRYAVEHAFDCGNVEIIERYFGHALSAKTGKATNKQFIETVVAVIERRSK